MRTALENGVTGGVWFSSIDKVFAPANLRAAFQRVARNGGAAGVDRQTVEDFSAQADATLAWLHEPLRTGRDRPSAVRCVWIPKAGSTQLRPLGVPTVRDRVVQGALKNVLEPIFERDFVEHRYGFRPKRSAKDALRRVEPLLREGYTHVVDADIESCFDRLDHGLLKAALRARLADQRVLGLRDALLQPPVREGLATWTPAGGAPQGAVLSPLLANLDLHPLDVAVQAAGLECVRYADDLVLLCRDGDAAKAALAQLTSQGLALRLTWHPSKTHIVDVRAPGGFDFLGYHFEAGRKRPRRKSWQAYRDRVCERTPRNSGTSFGGLVKALHQMLRGWYEDFTHRYRGAMTRADQFVRRRLRALLARRHRARDDGHGGAKARGPNAYFAKAGLFSCTATQQLASRSR